MKYRKSDYLLKSLFLVILLVIFLFVALPWIIFGQGTMLSYLQMLWIVFFQFSLVVFFTFLKNISRKYLKFVITGIWLLLNLLIIYVSGWLPVIFIPLIILQLFLSLRFFQYQEERQILYKDLFVICILFIVNLFLEGVYGFSFTIFQVIIFLLMCFLLILIYNIIYMKKEGYSLSKRITIFAVFFMTTLTIIVSVVTGYLSKSSSRLYSLLEIGYQFFLTMANYVLYPVALLIEKIIEIARKYSDFSFLEEAIQVEEHPPPESSEFTYTQEVLGFSFIRVFAIVVIVVLVTLLVYKIYIKLSELNDSGDKSGYKEEKESLYSPGKIKDDLLGFFNSLKNRIIKKNPFEDYDDSDPAQLVRKYYLKYLFFFNKSCSFKHHYTPRDYAGKLNSKYKFSEYQKSIIYKLTELYNKARYGGNISVEEAEEALLYWDKIKKNSGYIIEEEL